MKLKNLLKVIPKEQPITVFAIGLVPTQPATLIHDNEPAGFLTKGIRFSKLGSMEVIELSKDENNEIIIVVK